MEKTVRFDQFQHLVDQVAGGTAHGTGIKPGQMHPLALAYIGDAFFTLYVRTRLLNYEPNRVRVLHAFGSKIVSAAAQAAALRSIEMELTEEEKAVVRRGRNAKSTPTKNASVSDYRYSTGLEALLGYLFLTGEENRLEELAEKVFSAAMRKITDSPKDEG